MLVEVLHCDHVKVFSFNSEVIPREGEFIEHKKLDTALPIQQVNWCFEKKKPYVQLILDTNKDYLFKES